MAADGASQVTPRQARLDHTGADYENLCLELFFNISPTVVVAGSRLLQDRSVFRESTASARFNSMFERH
jgi:hypothetical protein